MSLRPWFFLYRPALPSARAQSVQVIHAAHALASRGHRVTLCAEGQGSEAEALAAYDLAPVPALNLVLLPHTRTLTSLRYRASFLLWARAAGSSGVALARSLKHAAFALRWTRGVPLVYEAHEVAGDEDLALEARVLGASRGLVCNAPGTLEILQERYRDLPPSIVIHNAARQALPPASLVGRGVGVVGSVRPYKDPETVARAAALSGLPVSWVGADGPLQAPLRAAPPVASREVPALLRSFRTLLLPLSPGPFGEKLTSPLKLWDALASGVPLVAADTSAVARAAPGAYLPYRPGDARSLSEALLRADRDEAERARVVSSALSLARTWDQRASEVETFVSGLLGRPSG